MSGPALHQAHAHHAIHEGGLSGAISKTEDLEKLMKANEKELSNQLADHLIEYWETRIISHADAEEEGFYKEIVAQKPHLEKSVIELTRDHDLIRIIIADIKQMKEKDGVTFELMKQFYTLITVNEIHSRDEIRLLFEEE